MKFDDAISRVQNNDAPEGRSHPPHDPDNRWVILRKYREAIAQQLLTPAPDSAAIAWKRAARRSGQHEYTDVKTERIERAIADDLAFLAAHPTKKSKPMSPEAKEQRRNFKEAMRQRIKEIAALRGIPDDEVHQALSLRHRHIAAFVTAYNVNFGWLLEGTGPIFRS